MYSLRTMTAANNETDNDIIHINTGDYDSGILSRTRNSTCH